ncbi:FG-GAP-like repeat-containing protein [Nocardioides sp. AE5]|uniref:FG-GAP-like repeat-containing protein n=1 Tax=Nocardioides sp. AE5 TaxID=2962573 RepID=UPI0028823830|nr:FG-GAP-like repeat-containing protein [Nocardioides sp. AE5]MDT0201896.1 FG-GAP-like repeat-containing protein [Nocardioides sp. AE5]
MRPFKSRYITACQQMLVLGAVIAVLAPAANVVSLDVITGAPPSQVPSSAEPEGDEAPVETAPVDPVVDEYVMDAATTADALVAAPELATDLTAEVVEELATKAEETTKALQGAVAADSGEGVAEGLEVISSAEGAEGYAAVGVTWSPEVHIAEEDLTVLVRTRSGEEWSEWTPVEYHDEHAPDEGSSEGEGRPGTEPLLVGEVDEVQARAVVAEGTELPTDLKLAVIGSGESKGTTLAAPEIDTSDAEYAGNEESAGGTQLESSDGAISLQAATMTAPKPMIYSRAQWGANEKLREQSNPDYGVIQAGFVHHTVNANNYTAEQVPAILRSIYAYHTQSRGWRDIGYNFLVDRFGRIWEGRWGGVDRPVVGAHTSGYNYQAFAMSAIGNFEQVAPTTAMLNAYGDLFAWKLALGNVKADGMSVKVGSKTMPAIQGHRDVGSTACPGKYLYAKISTIRSRAAAAQRTSINEFGPAFSQAYDTNVGWWRYDTVLMTPDVTGDGIDDVIIRSASSGVVAVRPGDGKGRFGNHVGNTNAFVGMDQIAAVGNFDGSGNADLVARDPKTGRLYLYPAASAPGTFAPRVQLSAAWSDYDLTVGIGDGNGDGRPDLWSRDRSGVLWFHANAGNNKLKAPVKALTNTARFDVITGRGDLDGDGTADLVVRNAASTRVSVYKGAGNGTFGSYIGPVLEVPEHALPFTMGNIDADKVPDLVVVNGNQMTGFLNSKAIGTPKPGPEPEPDPQPEPDPGPETRPDNPDWWFGPSADQGYSTSAGWSRYDTVLGTPDMTGDGIDDVVIRSGVSGAVAVRAGDGKGRYGNHIGTTNAFVGMDQLASVGNFDGSGRADLVARDPKTGRLYLYPAASTPGTFGSRILLSSNWGSYDLTVGIGDGDGDGRPDIYSRDASGNLWFHANAGNNKLKAPVKALGNTSRFDVITGRGDLTGDGKTDLVVRNADSGKVSIYQGQGDGRFGSYVGPVLETSGLTLPFTMADLDMDTRIDVLGIQGNTMVNLPNRSPYFTKPMEIKFDKALTKTYTVTGGWQRYDTVVATGDVSGDKFDDVVIRSGVTGDMAVRAGDGNGRFGNHIKVTAQLRGMDQITAVGDFDQAAGADLVARDPRTGYLYIFQGGCVPGQYEEKVLLSKNWSGYNLTVGIGDGNGDGLPDIWSRDRNGDLWFHANGGNYNLRAPVKVMTNTARFNVITGAGDLDGDGRADLVVRNASSSRVSIYPGRGDGSFAPYVTTDLVLTGHNLPFTLGDVNKDGKPDIIAIKGNSMILHLNRSSR